MRTMFTLVTGAPCSGKSSYVEKMRGERDLVIDLDLLQCALGSKRTHGHAKERLSFALAMRNAVLKELQGYSSPPPVWYISCWPTAEELSSFPGNVYRVQMPTAIDECKRRADASKRPPETIALIEEWFDLHGQVGTIS